MSATAPPSLNRPRVRRSYKYLPADRTPRILRYLEKYLEDVPNRKQAVKTLFGVSERQAGLLTSRKKPFEGRFRREWATRLAYALEVPFYRLVGEDFRSQTDALLGWAEMEPGPQAIEGAYTAAAAILHRAHNHFGLSGAMYVEHSSGRPGTVEVFLTIDPALAKVDPRYQYCSISVYEKVMPSGKRSMWFNFNHPHSGRSGDQPLTPDDLTSVLTKIYAFSKNESARLTRQLTRGAEGSR